MKTPIKTDNKIVSTVLTFFILTILGIGLGFISMYFGAAYFLLPMFFSYFKVDYLVFLNVFPVVLCIYLFYFIFNRVWVSFLITAFLTMALSWINYFKLYIRNDPLLAVDINLLLESMNMAGEYNVQLNWKIVLAMSLCLIVTVLAFFFAKGKMLSIRARLIGAIMVVMLSIFSYNIIYKSAKVYSLTENFDLINRWSPTQLYISKGFLYPFIYSIQSSFYREPTGYDKEKAKEMLFAYEYSDIKDTQKVHVISIMLEAYNDFSKFEQLEFNEEVYDIWHQLEDEGYSGELVTNIFAGNTVNTERSFLTGFTSLNNFRKDTNSYVHYFKEQGYTVEGNHPGYDWFYNRKNINDYLGFENYYYFENYYSKRANGQIARDSILFPEIIKLYEMNKKTGKPYFSFNVTYQNHGPYSAEHVADVEYVKNKGYTEEEYNIINNFIAGIDNTTKELKTFIDYFREEEEPVVIILFGDHNPWLGDNNSVYEAIGINLDLGTEEGFYNYYNTPYVIWGNDSAKERLNTDFKGEGPVIGPYFLMNEFFDLVGYEGNEFLKFSNKLRKKVDVVHVQERYKESGVLTSELSPEAQQILREYLQVQYYWRGNFR